MTDPQSIPLPDDIAPPPPPPSSPPPPSPPPLPPTKIEPPPPPPEETAMSKLLGFTSFGTTKGQQVPGNRVGAVHVVKKRRYRQYMNRKGGFNRPLDKVA